jgi:hypothetical protein
VLFATLFSFLNAGERVTLNLGFTILYRISLVGLVFAAFLLGMFSMFLFSLRHDRRVREALMERERERRLLERELSTYNPPPPDPPH